MRFHVLDVGRSWRQANRSILACFGLQAASCLPRPEHPGGEVCGGGVIGLAVGFGAALLIRSIVHDAISEFSVTFCAASLAYVPPAARTALRRQADFCSRQQYAPTPRLRLAFNPKSVGRLMFRRQAAESTIPIRPLRSKVVRRGLSCARCWPRGSAPPGSSPWSRAGYS